MTSFPTIDALIICLSPQIPGIHLSESFNTIKLLLTASLHPLPIHYRLTMHILHPIQSCLTCHFQPNKWSAGFHIYEEEKILNYQWHVVCVCLHSAKLPDFISKNASNLLHHAVSVKKANTAS